MLKLKLSKSQKINFHASRTISEFISVVGKCPVLYCPTFFYHFSLALLNNQAEKLSRKKTERLIFYSPLCVATSPFRYRRCWWRGTFFIYFVFLNRKKRISLLHHHHCRHCIIHHRAKYMPPKEQKNRHQCSLVCPFLLKEIISLRKFFYSTNSLA